MEIIFITKLERDEKNILQYKEGRVCCVLVKKFEKVNAAKFSLCGTLWNLWSTIRPGGGQVVQMINVKFQVLWVWDFYSGCSIFRLYGFGSGWFGIFIVDVHLISPTCSASSAVISSRKEFWRKFDFKEVFIQFFCNPTL